ncbi:MFS transporter [Nostocoides sp. F2B08]|uniref:MFS transporter n=1 Tax=Nostocoides sp. F2B08 TaxID=2653936 RepID=UPI001263CB07|nr:MFS transporter [Tetrasphaera sp. F2B08]KAB7743289.1 MFS transporter [Tetrasphaera sp. F2B08]
MTARRSRGLILLAIVLVSFTMRGAIAAVPPLIGELSADLGLTQAGASLLTSLPVLMFALAAPMAAMLGRRLGTGRAVIVGLVLIGVGTLGRVVAGVPTLLVGTAVIGVGITIANVLVPVVIKRDFGLSAGRVTGYFVATMAVGATATSALSVPAAELFGWRGALAMWTVLVPVAMVGWWLHVVRREDPQRRVAHTADVAEPAHAHRDGFVWRLPLAWALAIAFGSQSALYYSLTTWLPSILVDRADVTPGVAGVALGMFQLTAIPTALTIAGLTRLRRSQGWIGATIAVSWSTFLVGLIVAPALWPLWTVLGGLGQGAGFTFVLTLIVLRSGDEHVVRALGSMGQLVGYLVGAAGPFVVGWLAQTTGGWAAPAGFMLALAAALGLASLVAGRDVVVHTPRP